jgi:predicted lipid-binding transport protein (Tim44 family)
MFASRGFRLASLFACVVMALSMVTVDQAEARRGGSFGSRGTRTFQTAPATPTSPSVTAPVQRSTTPAQPSSATPRANTATPRQNSFFNGLGGSLMRGLFLGGLLGLLFGGGFGGFAGFLGLIVQVLLIVFVIRLVMGAMGRRSAQATAGGAPFNGGSSYNYAREPVAPQAARRASGGAQARRGNPDEIKTTQGDLDQFEAMLHQVQAAYGREDYQTLRNLTTPEMMSYLSEELGENASKGLKNTVSNVTLLQGDISESWREGNKDYATAAMRYSSVDYTSNRASGAVVDGNPDGPTEATELWTFVRERGRDWKLSAIQEA